MAENRDYCEAFASDDVVCKCRTCKQRIKGTCTHCITCIQGENNMEECEEYK